MSQSIDGAGDVTISPSYDPVQQPFEKCIRDFKADLKDRRLYSEILQTTTIDQVYDVTDKLQEEQAKNGHLRHLSKIGPFLEGLRGYADAIDTFVQVKPDILALIWGPIKLLLQWTSVIKESFDAIVNTIGDIGELLPEFQEVMRLFGHNAQIKDVLALFFQDILDIYVIALNFFSLSRESQNVYSFCVDNSDVWFDEAGNSSSKPCGQNIEKR